MRKLIRRNPTIQMRRDPATQHRKVIQATRNPTSPQRSKIPRAQRSLLYDLQHQQLPLSRHPNLCLEKPML
ncbi:MAG: hypothetical protein SGJ27_19175 [Candidatus Melainabacteria bacterium]|nr:hypothetical protein [Candidatus Melainabacteria bacterium]